MTSIEKTIQLIDTICTDEGLPYTIIGGIANIIHGSSRTTEDVDLIINVELENLETLYNRFTEEFKPLKKEPLHFFRTHFVIPLIHKELHTRVDLSAALSEFERRAIARSKIHPFGSTKACFCTPEDLVIFKLLAQREQDIIDVKDIVHRMKTRMDISYLLQTAKLFTEIGRPDIYETLRNLLE